MKKTHNRLLHILALPAALLLGTGSTSAQEIIDMRDMYISGSLGINFQDDSSTWGNFFGAGFASGVVTGVPEPVVLPSGTPVSWRTDYDEGLFFSLALGWQLEFMRMELEYFSSKADVDGHSGATIAGIDLAGYDAGVLRAGNVGDVGISTGELFADGQGEIDTTGVFVNGIYDFDMNWMVTPYVGLGLGMSKSNFDFRPGGFPLIDHGDTEFTYQLLLGASFSLNERGEIFANYRYIDAGEPDIDAEFNALFDASNESQVLDVGVRYRF